MADLEHGLVVLRALRGRAVPEQLQDLAQAVARGLERHRLIAARSCNQGNINIQLLSKIMYSR
jgi:hypothetical protein